MLLNNLEAGGRGAAAGGNLLAHAKRRREEFGKKSSKQSMFVTIKESLDQLVSALQGGDIEISRSFISREAPGRSNANVLSTIVIVVITIIIVIAVGQILYIRD